MFADEFSEYHDHHDGRGEVVEYCREDKGHEGDTPQQGFLAFGLQCVSDEIETAVLVYKFHDCHCSHEEEQCSGSAAKVVFNGFVDYRRNLVADGGR